MPDAPDIFSAPPSSASDRWYEVIRDRPDFAKTKAHIQQLWESFHASGLSDPHFETEFPASFFHRWWELEVASFLAANGFELSSKADGPDFIAKKGDLTIYVEAVACEPGALDSPDHPKDLIGDLEGGFRVVDIELTERERLELLRLRGSIFSKAKQCQKHLTLGMIEPGAPYVIALSPAMVPDMIADSDGLLAVLKAVYPVGHISMHVDRSTLEVTRQGRAHRSVLKKSNNSCVETDIFCSPMSNDLYKPVSGILYSPCSFIKSLYPEAMPDSFIFVHNLLATNPVEVGDIKEDIDYWIEEEGVDYVMRNSLGSAQ